MLLLLLLKCCFTSTETVGLLGTGAQYGHLDYPFDPNDKGIVTHSLLKTEALTDSGQNAVQIQV